jgi:hypothetical protein
MGKLLGLTLGCLVCFGWSNVANAQYPVLAAPNGAPYAYSAPYSYPFGTYAAPYYYSAAPIAPTGDLGSTVLSVLQAFGSALQSSNQLNASQIVTNFVNQLETQLAGKLGTDSLPEN